LLQPGLERFSLLRRRQDHLQDVLAEFGIRLVEQILLLGILGTAKLSVCAIDPYRQEFIQIVDRDVAFRKDRGPLSTRSGFGRLQVVESLDSQLF
jgi:hypothetical protein